MRMEEVVRKDRGECKKEQQRGGKWQKTTGSKEYTSSMPRRIETSETKVTAANIEAASSLLLFTTCLCSVFKVCETQHILYLLAYSQFS